jgi:putative addiction module component (TIGR02574 family)
MATNLNVADLLALSPAERILLVEDLWDSIAATPEAVPLTDAQRHELDARLAALARDPQAGSEWAAVKDRINKRS